MNKEEAWLFVRQYTSGQYTDDQHAAFLHWLHDQPEFEKEELVDDFTSFLEERLMEVPLTHKSASESLFTRIQQRIEKQDDTVTGPTGRAFSLFSIKWIGRVAAILLLVSGLAVIFYLLSPSTPSSQADKADGSAEDVLPGGDRAILTLGDGSRVLLDSMGNGELTRQGQTRVFKTANGQLAYNASPEASGEILYNSVATPRGGQYHIVLPDGSHVWLNAASSLRFPTVFKGAERQVELQGEAYFDIHPQKGQPFQVLVKRSAGRDSAAISVPANRQESGNKAYFNINSYTDEPDIAATLLKGRLMIGQGDQQKLLLVGQQARINPAGQIGVLNGVDTSSITAWKWGKFEFNSTPIEPLMRQLARWYDVEVRYEGQVNQRFNAKISRAVSLSEILTLLELTNEVHFTIRDRQVTVKP
ncbi:MAG: DUF4974 domain-containing protein [Sphingobacteriales bacterium]|nr:DUF4974 domain-containing protein [Sphingobacteriales bacterium]OJW01963.1 MAG: hypothetical protein BGO52_00325 [Sphingobacteriales bacterium 44-61]